MGIYGEHWQMVNLEYYQAEFNSPAGINYLVLVHCPESGATALVDAGDAATVFTALEDTGWSLTDIWITHHHFDHVEGLAEVKAKTGARATGPREQTSPITGLDILVGDGESFEFAGHKVDVIHTPGHTNDMINYYIADEAVVFTGDTLFSLGCGRMFEGTPAEFWGGLEKLAALPEETMVYCGHEYTEANAAFALSIDPNNPNLNARIAEVKFLRAGNCPTVPFNLGEDLLANPFLRAGDAGLRYELDMVDATDADVFGKIRALKDAF